MEYLPPLSEPTVIQVTVEQVQAMLDGTPVPDGIYVVSGTFTVVGGVVGEAP